ncbi:uncharacterized protein LOC114523259 [Dendronephthya gigantea]|uniref:uncharacterized protein LOC114523259 n=1 Tax=Dendronephthya gigantea TaxID=151771 RepID=UPI00106B8084|nr:uncharacterized protein LOC114523259 [Dendronephthya gigantea]
MFSKLLICLALSLQTACVVDALLFGPKFRLTPRARPTKKMTARERVLKSPLRVNRYLLQLYKELTTGDNGGIVKKSMPYSAHSIRGIPADVKKVSKSSIKIRFDLKSRDEIHSALRDEVHLHMNPPDPKDQQIFKPYVLRFKDIHTNKIIRKYKVPAFNQGWQVLSLNKWTNKWIRNSSTNEGFLLTIHRAGKPANKNPFVNFGYGNDPYLILYATDKQRSILAWRFLIQNALNSVAGNRAGKRITRDARLHAHGQRMTRNTNQRSQGQRLIVDKSKRPQCTEVERDVNTTNLAIGSNFIILHPRIYKMIDCSNSCITKATTISYPTSSRKGHVGYERYCCKPTKRRDVAVMLMDQNRGNVEIELFRNIVPTGCMWSRQ